MHTYVDSWHSHNGDKNYQDNKLSSLFLLYYIFIVVNKPTHDYNFSLLASFLGGNKPTKQLNLMLISHTKHFYFD